MSRTWSPPGRQGRSESGMVCICYRTQNEEHISAPSRVLPPGLILLRGTGCNVNARQSTVDSRQLTVTAGSSAGLEPGTRQRVGPWRAPFQNGSDSVLGRLPAGIEPSGWRRSPDSAVAPTLRACPELAEGSADAGLKPGATFKLRHPQRPAVNRGDSPRSLSEIDFDSRQIKSRDFSGGGLC